jgi:hypothetical protein
MPTKISDYLQLLIETKKISISTIADALHLSKDAIYRKLRGETDFLWNDILILQELLGFSTDNFALKPNPNKITFNLKQFPLLATPEATVTNYVQQLLADFAGLGAMGVPHLYYAAKDLPLFYFFSSPALTSFKLYFWYLTLFDTAKPAKYNSNWLPQPTLDIASNLYSMYQHIPSTEIWNTETINSTLDQIVYSFDSGLIAQKDALLILKALHQLVDNLEMNATNESKSANASFTLYYNKILILDNSVLFKIGEAKLFYLPIRTLNFISSTEPNFTKEMDTWLHHQIKKSTLISGEAEKVRMQFINNYKKRIIKTEHHIEAD